MNGVVERRASSLGADHPFTAASRKVLDGFRADRGTAPGTPRAPSPDQQ
ncbi:hypothetical protein [Streptomyces sulfonofaciens]|nr:hypothetical protein [Streptomyces sulfonofaciens]